MENICEYKNLKPAQISEPEHFFNSVSESLVPFKKTNDNEDTEKAYVA